MPYVPLTRKRIIQALRRLGDLAQQQHVVLELSLYGGAVFTLVYGSRDATLDVDAIFRPSQLCKTLARQVASEQGLPEEWLNDDVRQFLSENEAKRTLPGGEFGEGLRVVVPTAAYILAMKLRACRAPLPGYAGDYADIRFLLKKMELRSLQETVAIHDSFFPHDELSPEALELLRTSLPKQR